MVLRHYARERNIQSEAITVATIHQSKGMEFDKVFIIDLFEECSLRKTAQEFSACMVEIYEEVRLLYVTHKGKV